MDERSDESRPEPHGSPKPEATPTHGLPAETSRSYSAHLKHVDIARKAVAIGVTVCGLGFALCVRHENYVRDVLIGQEPRISARGAAVFGTGVLVCIGAVLAIIVEHLARPAPAQFSLRSLLLRSLAILVVGGGLFFGLVAGYGFAQGIGGVLGTFLLLAAVRERRIPRVVLAVSAAIVLGLTLLGTQSAYQYARWHADEIVAAGRELADQCPSTSYRPYNRHPEIDPSGAFASVGEEIQPSDPRVPPALRKLGARRIWVDDERVAVYVGVNSFDFSCIPRSGIEFQIYRNPHPTTTCNPLWGTRGKGATRITDKLWTNLY